MSKDYSLLPNGLLRWSDVRPLATPHKMLYLVSFLTENMSGHINVDPQFLALETGMEEGTIIPAFQYLHDQKLGIFDKKTLEFYPSKFWTHNFKLINPKTRDLIKKSISDVKSSTIKRKINKEIIHLLNKRSEEKLNEHKAPPAPTKDGGDESLGKLIKEAGLITFGLDESETDFVLYNIQEYSSLQAYQKALACFASLKTDSTVKNPRQLFKHRLKNKNFEDGGLLERFLKHII